MREGRKRKGYSLEFKAKVGLEALKGIKTSNEMGQEYGVHPVPVGPWKEAIQEQARHLFEDQRGPQPVVEPLRPKRLYGEIGKLKTELDWLKKSRGLPAMTRRSWGEAEGELPVVRQCVPSFANRDSPRGD